MDTQVKQFDSISNKYADFVSEDPIRNFLHYPGVIKILGKLDGQHILDVGCGDGLFDRKLAGEYQAKVTGYDKANDLIRLAKERAEKDGLDISYSVADPVTFKAQEVFDDAVSVMVICYAPDSDYLAQFFLSTFQVLKNGRRFISVVFGPNFKAFNQIVANRNFKMKDGKVEVNFLNPDDLNGEVKFTALLTQFSKDEYEEAARKSGFSKITWENMYPTEEGMNLWGKEFWERCETEQPYTILIAEK